MEKKFIKIEKDGYTLTIDSNMELIELCGVLRYFEKKMFIEQMKIEDAAKIQQVKSE